MIVFCQEVWNRPIMGTTTVYSSPDLNTTLAQAEKFFVFARVTQGGGTSPTIAVVLEHSNDGVTWSTKATLISATAYSTSALTTLTGQDTGTAQVGGCFMRVAITLGGTSPTGNFQLILTGRDDV